jgi:hypothetical protein
LPIHLTESSLVSGGLMPSHITDLNDYQVTSWPSTPEGEARQAEEVARHYSCLVSHPSVKSIVYWGITDRGAWLGAPIGFVRADGTRKPSYDALRGLVKGQWWIPPTRGTTDENGQFAINGWLGSYEVRIAGETYEIRLDKRGDAEVELQPMTMP